VSDPEDTPFARWSRRKLRARAEPADLPPDATEDAAPEPVAEAPADETEAETLDRLGLPDPDTLRMGDDFSVFMGRAVPEALRRRALRRLWLSNPVLANLDGLNDYDDDFTDSGLAGGALRTAYRAGKGYLRQITEERSEGDAASAVSSERQAALAPDAAARSAEAAEPAVSDAPTAADGAETVPDDPEPAPQPRPRRMRFDFSGQV